MRYDYELDTVSQINRGYKIEQSSNRSCMHVANVKQPFAPMGPWLCFLQTETREIADQWAFKPNQER